MSFMVKWPDGSQTYINGLGYPLRMNLKEEAKRLAKKVGGIAYFENGLPRFQKDGVDMFPRWIPLDQELPPEQVKLYELYKIAEKYND